MKLRFHFAVIAALGWSRVFAAPATVTVTIDHAEPGRVIPRDFVGLSFETGATRPDVNQVKGYFFDPANAPVTALFRQLGIKHLRVGGGSVDSGKVPTPPKADVDRLFGFARAAGVKVMYSVRLLDGSVAEAVDVCRYIWENHREQLDCFAIGNEPDWHAYHTYPGHVLDPEIVETTPGVPGSAFPSYLAKWRRFAAAIGAAAPGAKFAGPSTGSNFPVKDAKDTSFDGATWTTNFVRAEKDSGRIAAILQHNYVGQEATGRPARELIEAMLSPEWPAKYYSALFEASARPALAARLPYRLTESNSFSGEVDGGNNTFATALWALDYLHWWAAHDCAGVNFHNKQWVKNVTIYRTPAGGYAVHPIGYGIKAFEIGGHGRVLPVAVSRTDDINLTAHAVRGVDHLLVTLINKEHGNAAREATVALRGIPGKVGVARMELTAPNHDVTATTGIMLGGAAIAADHPWQGTWTPVPANEPGAVGVRVPAATAVILRISVSDEARAPNSPRG